MVSPRKFLVGFALPGLLRSSLASWSCLVAVLVPAMTLLTSSASSQETLRQEPLPTESVLPGESEVPGVTPVPISRPDPVQPSTPALNCKSAELAPSMPNVTRFVSDINRTVTWVDQPIIGVGSVFSGIAPNLIASLSPRPFPELHTRAREAKVPVMMYHDILAQKQVFFDVTPEEFEAHLKLIQQKGLTPISANQLMQHLRTGVPLPEKPILLTFDDGYEGHYTYVYPLLKKYNYPAVFSIYTAKVGKKMGRSSLSWEQVREMAKDPLVTIASHSVSHKVMTTLNPQQIQTELQESKRILEAELGIPIHYFTYPEGKYNAQVAEAVKAAGYQGAFTMDDADERLAGQSESLLAIGRIGQSRLPEMVDVAYGGAPLPAWNVGFDFSAPIQRVNATINNTPFIFIEGGKPMTIHAKTRGQVPELLAGTPAIAGVDGGFFSLEFLDSNEMLGPILSRSHGRFIPGKRGQIPFLKNRPLVLINNDAVRFVPFDYVKHNTLEGIQAEMPDVTDAFVAAGWLVENGQPQPLERFGSLYSVNELRHRAFWGINQAGQPKIGVSVEPIGSVDLGIALAKAGFRDAVMLDSGASTSLAFKGESLVGYTPRPVPHVVGLVPTSAAEAENLCTVATAK